MEPTQLSGLRLILFILLTLTKEKPAGRRAENIDNTSIIRLSAVSPHIYIYIYMFMCININTYIYIFMYMYIYVYLNVYKYIFR